MSIKVTTGGYQYSFYDESEYNAWQRQVAEDSWNNSSASQKLWWWVRKMIFGYSRVPRYGMYSDLIGIPGWTPGTRIPFFQASDIRREFHKVPI